ncbi:sugar transferase [Candidatus Uhrbacteria bacterium]|nr:sugar transferase [Candidatus Uhrbacteria bacterium]
MNFRRLDLTFTALLLPIDALALLFAGVSAYVLRFSRFVTEVRPILQDISFPHYLQTVFLFVIIWIVIFAFSGLYHTRPRKAWSELGRIIIACGAGTMITIATVFFRRELTTSRFIVLAVFGFSVMYVLLGRLFLRAFRHALLRSGYGHRRFAVIGMNSAATNIVQNYRNNPILGITIVKQFRGWNDETRRALKKLKESGKLDGVLLGETDMEKVKSLELIAFAEEDHLTFMYLADLFAASFTNIEVSYETGVPIIEVKRTRLDGWGRITKRAFDVFFALLLLAITSPILIIATLALAIEDGFPTFFLNERVGEKGELFHLIKLRSMWRKMSIGPQFSKNEKQNLALEKKLIQEKSIKQGPVYKISGDPRITPIGQFLRRWSIDELPQFFNVLKGDMSLVGPRPHQPREVDAYKPHHRRVLAIRPGITGLAQISGRSDLSFEDEVRLDTWYIENWSPALDLYILLKTPFAVLYRKGAY